MRVIFIDVPYDTALPIYQELEAYLENPDGTLWLPCVNFFYVGLEAVKRHEQEFKGGVNQRFDS